MTGAKEETGSFKDMTVSTEDGVVGWFDQFKRVKPVQIGETSKETKALEKRKDEEMSKKSGTPMKRKREEEPDLPLDAIITVFLRIMYPLSRRMKKFVVVGIDKNMDCKPIVLITDSGRTVTMNETAWNSLYKRMQLVECYLANRVYGKKTSFSLLDSDLEVDNIILRGEQYVRIRDLTRHDLKIQLTYEEFVNLYSCSPAIDNYIEQLHLLDGCTKDYITNTLDTLPNSQLVYSPVDNTIINRLPHEVYMYRRVLQTQRTLGELRFTNAKTAIEEEVKHEQPYCEEAKCEDHVKVEVNV